MQLSLAQPSAGKMDAPFRTTSMEIHLGSRRGGGLCFCGPPFRTFNPPLHHYLSGETTFQGTPLHLGARAVKRGTSIHPPTPELGGCGLPRGGQPVTRLHHPHPLPAGLPSPFNLHLTATPSSSSSSSLPLLCLLHHQLLVTSVSKAELSMDGAALFPFCLLRRRRRRDEGEVPPLPCLLAASVSVSPRPTGSQRRRTCCACAVPVLVLCCCSAISAAACCLESGHPWQC